MGKTRNTADLVSDNNISIDISNDRIGIGTINPQAKLHVVGDTRITGVVTAASFDGDLTGTATTATNANNINISSTPSDSTTYPVFVANSSTGNQTPFIDTGISWNALSNILTVPTIQVSGGIDLNDSDYIYFGSSDDVKVFYDGSNNDLEIELESAATQIAITDNGTYKHLITRDGKVGINTSVTPTVELEVNGNTNISGVVTATAFYGDGSNLSGVSGGGSSGIGTGVAIAMAIVFG